MNIFFSKFLIYILILCVTFQSVAVPLAEVLNDTSSEVVISEETGAKVADEESTIVSDIIEADIPEKASMTGSESEASNSDSNNNNEQNEVNDEPDPSYVISYENHATVYKNPDRGITNGETFTDEYGAVYTIRSYVKGNTTYLEAHLTSIPAGITSYTVPSQINVDDETSINVTEVKGNALAGASDLTDLSFESPEYVSLLVDSLLCSSLQKVNEGKIIVDAGTNNPLLSDGSKIYTSMFASVALDVGFPVASGELPALKESIQGEDTFMNVALVLKKRQPASGSNSYSLLTGDSAVFVIVIANSGINSSKTVRIYFEYDRSNDELGDGPNLGRYPVGEYELHGGGESIVYPFKVVKVNNPPEGKELYYYEIQQPQVESTASETLAFESGVFFPSPGSAGGSLKVWTEIVDSPDVPLNTAPTDWMNMNWTIRQSTFTPSKSTAGYYGSAAGPTFSYNATANKLYLNNLQYTVRLVKTYEQNSSENGRDYVKYAYYEDTLTLPKGIHLPQNVKEAVAAGNLFFNTTGSRYYTYSSSSYQRTARILRTTNPNTEIAYILLPDGVVGEILNQSAEISVDAEGREIIKISWMSKNAYLSDDAEYPSRETELKSFYIKYADNLFVADPEEIDEILRGLSEGEKYTIDNNVKARCVYTYGDDKNTENTLKTNLTTVPKIEASKRWATTVALSYRTSYADSVAGRAFRGGYFPSYITLRNTGSKYSDGITEISDTLDKTMYVTESDINKMFFEDTITVGDNTYHPGDWLTITIRNAYLYKEGSSYMIAPGDNETNKYNLSYSSSAGSSPSPTIISASSDRSIAKAARVITLKKIQGNKISLKCDDVDWIVGPGEEYETIEAAFKALGYLVYHSTTYNLTWQPGEELVLPTGNSQFLLEVRSTWKTTPMLTEGDSTNAYGNTPEPNAYSSTSGTGSNKYYYFKNLVRNSATVKQKTETGSTTSTTVSTDQTPVPKSELDLSKSISPSSQYVYGSVKNAKFAPLTTLTLTNRSGYNYSPMGISDIIEGAQMVLVPYEQNKNNQSILSNLNLEDTNNTVVLNDVKYIILRPSSSLVVGQSVTYTDVYFGSFSATNGYADTDNLLLAKSITVTWKNATALYGSYVSSVIRWELENWNETKKIYYHSYAIPGDSMFNYSDDLTSMRLNNVVWLGDHQGHRIYKSTYSNITKRTPYYNKGKTVRISNEEGVRTSYELSPGETITYELSLSTYNNPDAPNRVFTGDTIFDTLPTGCNWSLDGDNVYNNVLSKNITYLTNAPGEIKLYYIDPETNERANFVFDTTPVQINISSTTNSPNMVEYYEGHWDNTDLVGEYGEKVWSLVDGEVRWSENLVFELPDDSSKYLRIRMSATYLSDTETFYRIFSTARYNRLSWMNSVVSYSHVFPNRAYTLYKYITDENYENPTSSSSISRGDDVYYDIRIINGDTRDDLVKGIQFTDVLPGSSTTLSWRFERKDSQDSLYGLIKNVRYKTEGENASMAKLTYTTDNGEVITYDFSTQTWSNEELAKEILFISDTSSLGTVSSSSNYYYHRNSRSSGYTTRRFSTDLTYLRWKNSFQVYIPSGCTFHILVNLKFPSDGDAWIKASTNMPTTNLQHQNWFYLYRTYPAGNTVYGNYSGYYPIADYAEHSTGEITAVLRKGVIDTGWTRCKDSTSYYSYLSRNSRTTYANSPSAGIATSNMTWDRVNASTVTYYVALYNSGTERMYFGEFQDKLPKGFLFDSMSSYYDTTSTSYNNVWTTGSGTSLRGTGRTGYYGITYGRLLTYSQSNPYFTDNTTASYAKLAFISLNDDDFYGTKNIISTTINATTTMGSDGCQYLSFTSDRDYLDPGQVLVFGYNVKISEYNKTDDEAINTVTVVCNNTNNKTINIDDPVKIVSAQPRNAKNEPSNDIARNDGNCQQMTTEEISDLGFNTGNYTGSSYNNEEKGNWLVSQVSLVRQTIKPGIQKTIGGYTNVNIETTRRNPDYINDYKNADVSGRYDLKYQSAVQRDQLVNWRIRIYNESSDSSVSGNTMSPYTIVETAESPYVFVGTMYYHTYYENSNLGITRRLEGPKMPLFTIGWRAWDNAEKEAETGFRISSGEHLNLPSNTAFVEFGEWYDFGTGRMKIEREEVIDSSTSQKSYIETMTIELTNDIHSIPDGRYHEYKISTQYSGSTLLTGEMVYNNVKVYPNSHDSFLDSSVAQGRPFTEEPENPGDDPKRGVESGVGIMVSHGYATGSSKNISERTGSNTALSNDADRNSMFLNSSSSVFTYELKVDTPSENPISQITMIDHLPEPDDTSPFSSSTKRDSRYTVSFAKNPAFKVYLKLGQNGQEKLLNATEYILQLSEKTTFEAYDWTSATVTNDGWETLTGNAETDAQLMAKARSLRVILQRNIQAASTIRITFDAVVDDTDVKPGDTAWNSFGYRCIVVPAAGTEVPVEAQSQSSGAKFPFSPKMSKTLKDRRNNDYASEETSTFGYIIYKGDPISSLDSIDLFHKNADQRAAIEKSVFQSLSRANRDFIYVPVTVEEGTSETVVNLDGNLYCSTYDETTRNWVDKLDANNEKIPFSWANNTSYTVFELPITDYNYSASLIESGTTSKANNYSFTHKSNQSVLVKGTNTYDPELITIRGEKTWVNDKKDGSDRPETITLRILDDNNEKQGEMTATAETSWTYHYDGLKKYNSDGTEISYSLAEETVDGYTTTYEKVNSTTINVKNTMITHSLTLTKTVEGNMGDRTASFGFTIDGIGGRTVYVDETKVEIPENEKLTLNLKHGDSTTIALIPADAVLTVTEAEGNTGYLVTYTSTGESDPVTGKSKANFSLSDDTILAFTNTNDTGVPTGVFLKPEVWISMLVTALLLGILYIISRMERHFEL